MNIYDVMLNNRTDDKEYILKYIIQKKQIYRKWNIKFNVLKKKLFIIYIDKMESKKNIIECPICLEEIEINGIKIKHCDCNYFYHPLCIAKHQWIKPFNCPICRKTDYTTWTNLILKDYEKIENTYNILKKFVCPCKIDGTSLNKDFIVHTTNFTRTHLVFKPFLNYDETDLNNIIETVSIQRENCKRNWQYKRKTLDLAFSWMMYTFKNFI